MYGYFTQVPDLGSYIPVQNRHLNIDSIYLTLTYFQEGYYWATKLAVL